MSKHYFQLSAKAMSIAQYEALQGTAGSNIYGSDYIRKTFKVTDLKFALLDEIQQDSVLREVRSYIACIIYQISYSRLYYR